MTTNSRENLVATSSDTAIRGRRMVRFVSAAIAGSVAVFYLVYFFIVNASIPPGENAPVYLIRAILSCSVLFCSSCWTGDLSGWSARPCQAWLSACTCGTASHGAWNDPAAGILISVAEVALLALLVFLAIGRPTRSDQPVT